MIIRHRFFLLIHILCCSATIHGISLDANDAETCNLLCVQCNASAVFANDHCECNFTDDSDRVSGAECIQRIEREIRDIELNMLSEDLTDEERNVRSILKYRRRLRPESAPYASPTMQGVETYPILRTVNPAISYSTNGLYDMMSPLGSVLHPREPHLHNPLIRAMTLPAHILHHVLHPRMYRPVYHRGIVRSTNFPQETSDSIGQPCENNGDATTSNLPIARNNANEPAEQNVDGLTAASQYPYITHTLYQPEYQHFPYPYTSYYSPLMNMYHPVTNGYVFPVPVSQYAQGIPDPMTSAFNPQSPCMNNANTEQRSGVLNTDKAVYSNDGTEKSDNAIKNNIPKEEKKTEENRPDGS